MDHKLIEIAILDKLEHYLIKNEFKGWDLFDGLNSKVFKDCILYQSPFLRLVWIQLFKRSPINFRSLAKVPKGYNAKGLGLISSGLIYMRQLSLADKILKILESMHCTGYNGISWGYNFDWQARAFFVPKNKPNIVTSVFVANAFLDYFDACQDDSALNIATEVCNFILEHLILSEDKDKLCFGYIPGESAKVHNANMLGASLLARVYSISKEPAFLEKSRKSMVYSIEALNKDYCWPYGERKHHQFIDNFHTGFNLVALSNWISYTKETQWEKQLTMSYNFFLEHFWTEDGCPKYYHNSLYPIDIHATAQGIVTCIKLHHYNSKSSAFKQKIQQWAFENMLDKNGYFYYQKTKLYTNKIAYIRWSQAWMFYALALSVSSYND